MKIELSTDDVIEAVCKALEPLVAKRQLAPGSTENKYGVEILYKKDDPAMICFHFITRDLLEVELPFDLMELQRKGKVYIDERFAMLYQQLPEARKVRQAENAIVLNTPAPRETPVSSGVSQVLH